MSAASTLLTHLDQLAQAARLRRLGIAFARFLHTLSPLPVDAIMACVILSELEGRGHSCLLLADLANAPADLIGLNKDEWLAITALTGPLPATVPEWGDVLSRCTQIWTDDSSEQNQPLALAHDRLYLRRFWRNEKSIADAIVQRTTDAPIVDTARVTAWLTRLFPHDPEQTDPWQKAACAIAVRRSLTIITGGPGTGKTYTVARLLALLFALSDAPQQLRIAMAAPSGKAAVRLKQSIDQALSPLAEIAGAELDLATLTARLPAAKTLHSLLGFHPDSRAIRHHAGNLLDVDVLIVDEASMVNLEMIAFVLDALPANAMLILLGDKDQLSSVEAGAVLGDLCVGAEEGNYSADTAAYVQVTCGTPLPAAMIRHGSPLAQQTVMLRKSRRFDSIIGQLALTVNAGDVQGCQACFSAPHAGELMWWQHATPEQLLLMAVDGRTDSEDGYRRFLVSVKAGPADSSAHAHRQWVEHVLSAFDKFRILCAVRDGEWGVEGVNAAIERRLQQEKLIDRRGEWYPGRPVMVGRNDYNVGVLNGDVGIALPDGSPDATLRVYFSRGDNLMSVLPTRLAFVETAFAMTVHKVQGSEFHHTVLILPKTSSAVVTRELIYTAVTRASKTFTLLTPDAGVLDEGIRRPTLRASGLGEFLRR